MFPLGIIAPKALEVIQKSSRGNSNSEMLDHVDYTLYCLVN